MNDHACEDHDYQINRSREIRLRSMDDLETARLNLNRIVKESIDTIARANSCIEGNGTLGVIKFTCNRK